MLYVNAISIMLKKIKIKRERKKKRLFPGLKQEMSKMSWEHLIIYIFKKRRRRSYKKNFWS